MSIAPRRALLLIAAAVAAAYLWSIHGAFHFDDSHAVEQNLALRSLGNIPSYWTGDATSSAIPENRSFRPLVFTLFSLAWVAGGGATWPFHLMKLLMVAGVCFGIFLVWRRLFREAGWLGEPASLRIPLSGARFTLDADGAALAFALLFAVHPAGSECAIYISSTTSLQAALFYVWAYWAYLMHRDEASPGRLALALLCYFLSVASKEEGITLPAVVLVTELMLGRGPWTARLRAAAPRITVYALAGVALAAWLYAMRSRTAAESRGDVAPLHYFMTQWRAYLWYMRTWFWPFELNADNVEFGFSRSLADGRVIQALLGNALVLGATWALRRRFPALLFGVIWFYVTISPASSVIPLAEPVNERRMYLAYVGFAGGTLPLVLTVLGSLLPAEDRERRLGWIAAAVVLGLYAGTLERNRVWLNAENLWRDTVAKNPTSGRAMNNLALVHMGRAEYAEALRLLEECERHWSSYVYCSVNRGVTLEALKRTDEAETAYRRAVQLAPRNLAAAFHLGRFLDASRGDCAGALPWFRAAVELSGGRYPDADLLAGGCLLRLGRTDEADSAFARAAAADPGNEATLFRWGLAEQTQGRPREAIPVYRRLLELNPGHVQGWYNLGVASLTIGDLAGARQALERTVELDPRSEGGLISLTSVYERLGERARVEAMYRRLAEVFPDRPAFRARAQAAEGRVTAGTGP